MKTKIERLITIKEIIYKNKINSQEKLLEKLNAKGFKITQATLSRDLKHLKIAKIPNEILGYIYELPQGSYTPKNEEQKTNKSEENRILSIEFSNNIAIIKTEPGFASGIAGIIDNNKPYEILGTIAGDDTILLALRENISKNIIIESLERFMPGASNKVR